MKLKYSLTLFMNGDEHAWSHKFGALGNGDGQFFADWPVQFPGFRLGLAAFHDIQNFVDTERPRLHRIFYDLEKTFYILIKFFLSGLAS